jgi:hypothetical protein
MLKTNRQHTTRREFPLETIANLLCLTDPTDDLEDIEFEQDDMNEGGQQKFMRDWIKEELEYNLKAKERQSSKDKKSRIFNAPIV